MDVKEAVKRAKAFISDLFADEDIRDLGLEEVEYDEASREWRVTIGFTRPWDRVENPRLAAMRPRSMDREFKVVIISALGTSPTIRNRSAK